MSSALIRNGATQRSAPVFVMLAMILFSGTAQAAVKFWSGGGGGNGIWSLGANWGGTPPNAGDDLVFPNVLTGLRNTNDFVARAFNSIAFTGSNYIVQGNALFLTNGLSAQHPNFTNTFNPSITLRAPQTIECTMIPATLILGGDITMGTNNLVLNAVGRMEESGVISGSGTVTKNGGGTNLYRGPFSNTYTNLTTVNAGTLELLKSGFPAATAIAGNIVVGDGLTASTLRNLAVLEIADTANVTVNRLSQWNLNNNNEAIANLTLSGGNVASGTGTLILGGNVTTLASTSIADISGNLSLGGATRTFSVAAGGAGPDLFISAAISDGPIAGAGINKTGGGQLTLFGANTYTGPTTLSGFVTVANGSALGASGQSTNGTVVNANSFLLVLNVNIPDEFLTLNTGDDFRSSGTASWAGPITLNDDVVVNVFGGTFTHSGVISGIGGITKGQAGTLIFSGSSGNTYSGDTVVNTGVLQLSKNSGLFAVRGSSLVIGDNLGGDGADIVRYTANGQLLSSVPITINSSGLLDLNNFTDDVGAITFSGGRVNTGTGTLQLFGNVTADANTNSFARIDGKMSISSTRTFDVAQGTFSPDLRIAAAVSGAGGITKIGPGEMSLTTSNTYGGVTTVSAGLLVVDDSFALGATNAGTTVASGAILDLRFGIHVGLEPLTLNGPGGFDIFGALSSSFGSNSWDGTITLASSSTLAVLESGDFLNLTGPIIGAGDLTKIGTGTLIFSGGAGTANTYGNTFINEGALILSKTIANACIPNHLTIGDGSGGALADVVRYALDNQIADTAAITIAISGLLDLNGMIDTTGSIDGSGRIDLGSGILRAGADNGTATYSGLILGTGTLFKFGTGTWTLTRNNTYSGQTTVSAGTLVVNGSQPQSPVIVNGSATLMGRGVVGNLQMFGNLRPGTSPGVLTSSNVAFSSLADYFVELNGSIPGVSHDQLSVRGTNQLGSSTLHLSVGAGFAPAEGEEIVILNNDGSEAIVGTFTGLANGSLITAGGLQFRILYSETFGNDVILIVTNTSARFIAATVSGGNLDGNVDVNECNLLSVAITNVAGVALTGVTGTLIPKTPGVSVTVGTTGYPNIPLAGRGTNTTPFQFSTSPAFVCGTNLDFELVVSTAANGTFTIPFSIPSGSAGASLRFNNNTATAIPDLGSVDSPIIVSGITTPLQRVTVSMHITHTADSDLDISLIAPDGTTVDLSSDNGGTGDDYGTDCADAFRTQFSDLVATAIQSGAAPFAGAFKPEQALLTFNGKFGTAVNGTWRLRIADDTAGGIGTLRCWSLFLAPTACTDGGGACESCPEDRVIRGVLGVGSLLQTDRLTRDDNSSACALPKTCPGALGSALPRRYDAYTFENGDSNACITVTLSSDCALFSAAYLNSYDPANFCANYLADMGNSTDTGATNYSFNVSASARFVIVVNEVDSLAGCGYTLRVDGGNCRPKLNIAKIPGNKVALDWSTAALGYGLERITQLRNPPNPFWVPVPEVPVITGGRFRVTNNIALPPTNSFYQLRK